MTNKQEYKALPNGDIEGVVEYKENKVTIKVAGIEYEIGVSPAYKVKQIVHKDKIPILLKYLEEQKDYFNDRLKKTNEVIEKTADIDLDKLSGAILNLPTGKDKFKKLQGLDRLAKDFYMKSESLKNKQILDENMLKIEEQIDFLKKQI